MTLSKSMSCARAHFMKSFGASMKTETKKDLSLVSRGILIWYFTL